MREARNIPRDETWLGPVQSLLARAPGETKLLGIATPINAAEERARLVAALESGHPELPRWRYAAMDGADALRRALDAAGHALDAIGSPLALAYAARARELAIEAELSTLVGRADLGVRARARFAIDSTHASAARDLARAWA